MKTFLNWIKSLFGLGPKAPMKWDKRLTRQMMFFSAPNYYWMDADAEEVCDAILEAGLDGPSIEFGGSDTSKEYNGQPTTRPVKAVYESNIKTWSKWQKAIESRGLVAHIAFLNTNSKRNNTVSDTEWANLANAFIAAHGSENKIILPASETDSRTRPSIRSILEHTFRQRVPAPQIVTHSGQSVGYTEHHSQKGNDVPRGDKDNLTVSDSGPAIAYLYGGDWRFGGSPNIANITTYVRSIKAAGTSGAVYSFSTEFDKDGCKAAGKAWKA